MRGRVATKYVGATAEKKMFCNVIFRRLWMKRLKIYKRLKNFFDYKLINRLINRLIGKVI